MQTPGGEALLAQKTLHHTAACKRIVHVQIVDPPHQPEVIFCNRAWRIVQAAPADPEQIGLAGQTQLVIAVGHFFALPNRPALASTSPKKSFSSVNWPIFA